MKKFFSHFLLFLLTFFIALSQEKNPTILKIIADKYSESITQSNEPIRFNFVRLGNIKRKTIYIENAGTFVYQIQGITFLNNGLGVFTFSSTPSVPVTLLPSEAIYITLNFQPDKINKFYDTLLIKFTEPFDFIYSLPIEGSSIAFNLLYTKDTSEFVGTNNFSVPIFLKGDPELTEGIPLNFTFSVCVNSKLFLIDRISNGTIIENNFNQTFNKLTISTGNIILDSSTKIVTNLIGRLLLSDQDTTIISFDSVELDIPGIYIQTQSGIVSLLGICVSDISLIDFDKNMIKFSVPQVTSFGTLKIQCDYNFSEKRALNVKLFDILGKLVYYKQISLEPEIELPLTYLPSGIYRIEIEDYLTKYSKIISVIK